MNSTNGQSAALTHDKLEARSPSNTEQRRRSGHPFQGDIDNWKRTAGRRVTPSTELDVLAHILCHFCLDGETVLYKGKPATITINGSRQGRRFVYVSRFGRRIVSWTLAQLKLFLHKRVLPECVDHENGDHTCDALSNLRPATHRENSQNCKRRPGKKSGLARGVAYLPNGRSKPYFAYGQVDGRSKNLGYFATEAEAAEVAQAHREKVAGPFFPGIRYRGKSRQR